MPYFLYVLNITQLKTDKMINFFLEQYNLHITQFYYSYLPLDWYWLTCMNSVRNPMNVGPFCLLSINSYT